MDEKQYNRIFIMLVVLIIAPELLPLLIETGAL
jgi:hypothetical protein